MGDAVSSGNTSTATNFCLFHDHASTICLHGQGTLSVIVSGTNVTDNDGVFNRPGTFIVGKIVNGSGKYLGKRAGYVIAEIVDDKTRNNYIYFINNASQSEVDRLKSKMEKQSAQIRELQCMVAALQNSVKPHQSSQIHHSQNRVNSFCRIRLQNLHRSLFK